MNRIVVISANQQISVDTQEVTNVIVLQEQKRTIVLQSEGVQGPSGPAGPQGPAGPNEIGGYGFDIDGLSNNDLLQFKGTAWENVPQETIADGGNF
jgi:hypothetical protein